MDGKLVSVRNSRTSSTPWVITQDDTIATIDYYGNRFMGVLEFATVLEAIKRS